MIDRLSDLFLSDEGARPKLTSASPYSKERPKFMQGSPANDDHAASHTGYSRCRLHVHVTSLEAAARSREFTLSCFNCQTTLQKNYHPTFSREICAVQLCGSVTKQFFSLENLSFPVFFIVQNYDVYMSAL